MNILIVNEHSALNLGDDAIMYETFRALKVAYPKAKITLAANDPDSWLRYTDIRIIGSLATWVVNRQDDGWYWRKHLLLPYAGLLMIAAVLYRLVHFRLLFGSPEQRDLFCAYYDADLVLSCGGGVFYAHHSFSPGFIWALLTLIFADFLGKKTIMLPQSIVPVEGCFQRIMARLVFNRVSRILLREDCSLAFLDELGVNRPAIVLPDLAFALPPVSDTLAFPSSKSGALRIGVTVIDRAAQNKSFSRQHIYEDALVSLLLELSREHGAHLYLFSQCYGPTRDQDDRHSTRRIYERIRQETSHVTLLNPFHTALEIKAAYKSMDCVIGSRTHTGIFSLSNIVPVVLIGYQPKALGVMEMFGLERYYCSIETVTEDELNSMIHEVLENSDKIKMHIAQRYSQIQAQLLDWTRYLED